MPDKGFSGADKGAGPSRSGPVQFQREEEDPFGLDHLDQFLKEAKKTSGKRTNDEGGDRDRDRDRGDRKKRKDY